MADTRTETDSFWPIGSCPSDKYWGAQDAAVGSSTSLSGGKQPVPIIRALGRW